MHAPGGANVNAMAGGSPKRGQARPKTEVDRRIEAVAADQLHLIDTAQLAGCGLGPRGARFRVASHALHRVQMNVHALHPPPYSQPQRLLAATMTYGPGALVSHEASGIHQRFRDGPLGTIDVITERAHPRSRGGITVHPVERIDPRDVRRVSGVPCASADLVLVQLAPSLGEMELERALVAAESLGYVKRGRLSELVAERRGRPGVPKLEALLELEPVLSQSDLELLFLPLWRPAGLERPLTQHRVAVPAGEKLIHVDFYWPRLRMVVEADSQRFHGDWERAEIDRERDQLLALTGRVCHRFVRRRVRTDPLGCARRLRQLAEIRAREIGLDAAAATRRAA